jgi:hypothetical protein
VILDSKSVTSNANITALLLSICNVLKAAYPAVLDIDQWTRVLEKLSYSEIHQHRHKILSLYDTMQQ